MNNDIANNIKNVTSNNIVNNINITTNEVETILFALKIVKHFVPYEVNQEHKDLYDKLRQYVTKTKEFKAVNK